jgi:indolepyruvate ferredoxin oxidoreductase
MAYKDEYEVARLALEPGFDSVAATLFGANARVHYRLHPPFLRALGRTKKLALGRWFRVPFRVLRSLRGLRGTLFDPFGYDEIRRVERQLITEYQAMMTTEVASLNPESRDRVLTLARLPDLIRGYEGVKRANVVKYRSAIAQIVEAPTIPPAGSPSVTQPISSAR